MNERKKALLTLRVLSTSPQGNLFTKSIPVSGVPVGGNRIEASIIKYSTFMGLICKNILTLICYTESYSLHFYFQIQFMISDGEEGAGTEF